MSTAIGRWFSVRILWKEYRQMRSFWLAMAVLTVLLQLIAYVSTAGTEYFVLYVIGLAFPAFYALGCGATMFAAEHENGTYEFLRRLPVSGPATTVSKAAFSLLSTPLLLGVTWSTAALISGLRLPDAGVHRELWLFWGFAWVEFLVWSTLFSLLLHQPLKAAIFGAVAACLSLGYIMEGFGGPMGQTIDGVVMRAGLASLVAAVDLWLGARWYREAPAWRDGARSEDRKRGRDDAARVLELELFTSKSSTFAHLVWLQWRQSRGMILVLTALVAPLVLRLWWLVIAEAAFHTRELTIGNPLRGLWIPIAACAVPLAGAGVFAGDQRGRRFRFLTDRGISPRAVWWSRQAVWVATVLGWVLLALLPLALAAAVQGAPVAGPHRTAGQVAFWAALSLLAAYGFGQFCSLIFRSGIVAATLALTGAALLGGWTGAMIWLDVNPFWSVLPIPFVLVLATWLRTAGWMLERDTPRSWLPLVLVLAVPAVAILAGVCLHRAYEIPAVDPGFSVAEFTAPASPEARETAEMYRRAHDMMAPGKKPRHLSANDSAEIPPQSAEETAEERHAQSVRWIEANREAIALAMEASRRLECDAFDPSFARKDLATIGANLSGLLVEKGAMLQRQGDLDGAAEHYLAVFRVARHVRTRSAFPQGPIERAALAALIDWSRAEGQTGDKVGAAVRELEELITHPPSFGDRIRVEHVRVLGWIEGELVDLTEVLGPDPRESIPVLALYWLPWERTRATRGLNMHTREQLAIYQQTERALAQGLPFRLAERRDRDRPKWLATTPILGSMYDEGALLSEWLVQIEVERRALRIQLALKAWELDHGDLPESLGLLEEDYLADLPLDPYAGEPFVYFPGGLEVPIERLSRSGEEALVVIEAGKPFLWSPGPAIQVTREKHPLRKYLIGRDGETRQAAASAHEVWTRGLVFPIL